VLFEEQQEAAAFDVELVQLRPWNTRTGPLARGAEAAGRCSASASSQSKALLISAGLKPAWSRLPCSESRSCSGSVSSLK
jgi:hypothetical protein